MNHIMILTKADSALMSLMNVMFNSSLNFNGHTNGINYGKRKEKCSSYR